MDSVSVSRDDIDALAQALDTGTLPAIDLLSSLVAAIRAVSGDDETVTVSVEVGGPEVGEPEGEFEGELEAEFGAAFTPDPAPGDPALSHRVHVSVKKITR